MVSKDKELKKMKELYEKEYVQQAFEIKVHKDKGMQKPGFFVKGTNAVISVGLAELIRILLMNQAITVSELDKIIDTVKKAPNPNESK